MFLWQKCLAYQGSENFMTVLNFYAVGKTIPEGAVYVGRGRGSSWGNPFTIGPDGSREDVITKHREWFLSQPEMVARAKRELKNKDLVCFCAPKACHADTLSEIANN